ncbi:MAG: ATP-binding protein [Pseudomonadales bacterium]|nr:ATP-binding protein [Pseudomonadales bacterium]
MKLTLTKQLFIVSLCTLLLPWTGCQYVREMETLVRQQQSYTLQAFTKPLAEHIKTQPGFSKTNNSETNTNSENNNQENQEAPFFAPLSSSPMVVDGYDDEWISFYESKLLRSDENATNPILKTAIFEDHLYLFLMVFDSDIQYYNPTQPLLKEHDWIRIQTKHSDYQLLTSAPGTIQVFKQGKSTQVQEISYDMSGNLQEQTQGYQVEIKIPVNLVKEGLRLEVIDRYQGQKRLFSTADKKSLPTLLIPSNELNNWLKPFQRDAWHLQVINEKGWPLLASESGSDQLNLPLITRENLGALLLNRIYRFFLESTLPVRFAHQWPLASTQLSQLNQRIPIELFINSEKSRMPFSQWYALNESNQSVLLVIQPITISEQVVGYVLATQTENALLSFTNQALRRTMNLSLATFITVVVILLGYAATLSVRIRKLKSQTEQAINEDGSITPYQPNNRSDEIGELSQSYASLLMSVKNYNEYLQSLTHKLAHEIRTPLAIVKSSLEMLDSVPKEEQPPYIERALQGNQRLANILNAMSESTQVEQMVQHADFHALNISQLINDLCLAYQQAYPDHCFTFTPLADENSSSINGNPELIAQMIDKLVDNARDFTPPNGTIEITIKADTEHCIISVVNEGSQLPEQMALQLFDSLISVRNKPEQSKDGTHLGLGLYIVRLIANAHHGSVRAFNLSQPKSVCFEVSLPSG